MQQIFAAAAIVVVVVAALALVCFAKQCLRFVAYDCFRQPR